MMRDEKAIRRRIEKRQRQVARLAALERELYVKRRQALSTREGENHE